jgi:hypothetical protein
MKTSWSRPKKIASVAYVLALAAMTAITVFWFNKLTFGALFVLIALWPVGQFFLNKNQ